jgi:hypothetical protein
LVRGIKYPYKEVTHPVNLLIWKLAPNEKKIAKFDKEKILQHSGKLKISKEICVPTFSLPDGEYIIIPSTKSSDMLGDYTLNVYFNARPKDKNDNTDKYVTLQKAGDDKLKFYSIAEEEEKVEDYPQELQSLLQINSKFVIY